MGFYCLAGAILFSQPKRTRILAAMAGIPLALSVWTTQSFLNPTVILLVWFLVRDRANFGWLAASTIGCGLVLLAILGLQGGLPAFLDSMFWTVRNYSSANRLPFGYNVNPISMRYWLSVYPGTWGIPFVLLGTLGLIVWKRDRRLELPFLFCFGLLLTAYPKWDSSQLLYLTGPFLALGLAQVIQSLPVRAEPFWQAALLMPAAFFLLAGYAVGDSRSEITLPSGHLSGTAENVAAIQGIAERIPENSTLFVYPYLTALYPLLHARNPNRYEYLQPGMMSLEDETIALAGLTAAPPQFIYWHVFPASEILKIWPNTDPSRLTFPRVERFIESKYDPGPEFTNTQFVGRIWTLKR